jgi:hypothetical protein
MPETPDVDVRWTVDTYAAHNEAMRVADHRFEDERDRRYTEVNIEKEKALKIKETADLAALSLARESQTYKEQQNDALRDKNLAESGVYARASDVDKSIEKLANTFNAQFETLLTKLEPFMNGTIQQKGLQQGSQLTKANLYAAIGAITTIAAIAIAVLKP